MIAKTWPTPSNLKYELNFSILDCYKNDKLLEHEAGQKSH
jgi:hypothetical protein